MRVQIERDLTSVPIIRNNAISTYQKGSMFCVKLPDRVEKYPVDSIFRVTESE